eukprot:6209819-Pleurochrysis_carterae.AAC.4
MQFNTSCSSRPPPPKDPSAACAVFLTAATFIGSSRAGVRCERLVIALAPATFVTTMLAKPTAMTVRAAPRALHQAELSDGFRGSAYSHLMAISRAKQKTLRS